MWSCKLSLHVAVHVQPCRKKDSRTHSRAANKLPHLCPTTELTRKLVAQSKPNKSLSASLGPFRLHPHPSNHRRMHTTWRDGLHRHTWCRDCCLTVTRLSLVVRFRSRLLVGSLSLLALYGIDILITPVWLIDFSIVHPVFALLASQVLSHTNTHPLSRFFVVSRPVEESFKHVSGKHGSLRSCFSLSGTISENFDSCSNSVNFSCMTATSRSSSASMEKVVPLTTLVLQLVGVWTLV